MNSTSPPTPVTASPVATPGTAVRSAASKKNFWRPRYSRTSSASIVIGASTSPRRDLRGDLAQRLAQLPLEVPHAGLTRVVADDRAQRVVGEHDLVGAQAVALALALTRWCLAIATFSSSVYPSMRMTSMRSNSGPGIVSATFAVVMNSTSLRSRSTSR